MLNSIHPKLPMRNKIVTLDYYSHQLGFSPIGREDYTEYLMMERDHVELHFFLFQALDPLGNYGQVYIRTKAIDIFYAGLLQRGVAIHPNGKLATKPWGQREFSLLDPDHNLLTFGQFV